LAVTFEAFQALGGLIFDGTNRSIGALARFDITDSTVALNICTEVNFAVVSDTWNTFARGGVTHVGAITRDIFTEIGLAFRRVVVGTSCRKQQ
jgi:hypothetical protein